MKYVSAREICSLYLPAMIAKPDSSSPVTSSNSSPLTRRSTAWVPLHLATLCLAILSLLAALGAKQWWGLELLCHFRAQFFVAAAVATVLYLAGRRWRVALWAALLLGYQTWGLVPFYVGGSVSSNGPNLRIVSFNVFLRNAKYDEAIEFLRATDADVIAGIEITGAWSDQLHVLRDRYPFFYTYPNEGSLGLLVASRLPLEDVKLEPPSNVVGPIWTARLKMPNDAGSVNLVLAHPPPPTAEWYAQIRATTFERLEVLARGATGPLVVFGDFNCTNWSPYFIDLCRAGNLVDARRGQGLQPSWPSWLPELMQLPIDHFLVSEGVLVHEHRLGPACGSDHKPIIVGLEVPAVKK